VTAMRPIGAAEFIQWRQEVMLMCLRRVRRKRNAVVASKADSWGWVQ
jgi:hypothetical protein